MISSMASRKRSTGAEPLDLPTGVTLVSRINGLLPDLRPSERRVAEAVVEDPATVARESITTLAQRCNTSAPTVVRFAKRLGLPGYPQLKLALAKEAGIEEGRNSRGPLSGALDASDSLEDVVSKISYAGTRALEETAQMLDVAALEKAVDAVVSARRIDLVGVGAGAVAVLDLDQKLSRLGLATFQHPDRHGAMTAVSLRGEQDVVIGISHSGSTADVLAPIELARSLGATTIGITNHPTSQLASTVDITLLTASRETSFRPAAMASRIAQLMVIDCLLTGVAMRDMEATQRALDASFRAVADL